MILTTLRITCEFSPIFWLRKLTHRQTGWSSPRNELEGTHGLERWVQTPNLSFCRPRAGLTQGCAAPEAACCRQGPDSELFKPNIWPSWFIGHCDRLLLTPHLLTSSLLARGHIWHFVHFASSSPPISFSSSLAFLKFISVPPQFPSAQC